MHYVYILQSQQDGTYYIGMSNNLKRRILEHKRKNVTYTSGKSPYRLVWYGSFRDQNKASQFEKYLKSSSGFAFRNKHLV